MQNENPKKRERETEPYRKETLRKEKGKGMETRQKREWKPDRKETLREETAK